MFIKHLIGPRKGEVEDVVFDRARAKVLSGEAEDIYHQLAMPPKVVSIASDEEVIAGELSRLGKKKLKPLRTNAIAGDIHRGLR